MTSRDKWNREIRDSVDSLLKSAGYDEDSSARHQLGMMNFDGMDDVSSRKLIRSLLEEYGDYAFNEQDLELVDPTPPPKDRPHAGLIIAWAKGADIQYSYDDVHWTTTNLPAWEATTKYRIKPKEPVIVPKAFFLSLCGENKGKDLGVSIQNERVSKEYNVMVTIDETTGKLIDVQLIADGVAS